MITHKTTIGRVYPSHGFTLVEILLSLVIFSISAVAIAEVYILGKSNEEYLRGSVQVRGEGLHVVEVLNRELRTGRAVMNPAIGITDGTLTIFSALTGTTTYTASGTQLVRQVGTENLPMTSKNLSFTGFSVTRNSTSGVAPAFVEYSFTLARTGDRADITYQKQFQGGGTMSATLP